LHEVAYYPNSGAWQGEFHKVTIKSKQPGIHLEYREGYFAHSSEEKVDPKYDERLLEQAACQDVLTATSVLMVTKAFPEPDTVRYFVAIEPGTITFKPETDGTQHVRLKVGLCSFDKSGKPLPYCKTPSTRSLARSSSRRSKHNTVSHAWFHSCQHQG
jgi:hypothetical protein